MPSTQSQESLGPVSSPGSLLTPSPCLFLFSTFDSRRGPLGVVSSVCAALPEFSPPRACTHSSTSESLNRSKRPTRCPGEPFESTHRYMDSLATPKCVATLAIPTPPSSAPMYSASGPRRTTIWDHRGLRKPTRVGVLRQGKLHCFMRVLATQRKEPVRARPARSSWPDREQLQGFDSFNRPDHPRQHLLRRPPDHVPAEADLDDVPHLLDFGLAQVRGGPPQPLGNGQSHEDEHGDRPPSPLQPALALRPRLDDLGCRTFDFRSSLEDGRLERLPKFDPLQFVLGIREDTVCDRTCDQRWSGLPEQPGGQSIVDSTCLIVTPASECAPRSESCHGPVGGAISPQMELDAPSF